MKIHLVSSFKSGVAWLSRPWFSRPWATGRTPVLQRRAVGGVVFAALMAPALLAPIAAFGQRGNFRDRMRQDQARTLAAPMVGITTNGAPVRGLFDVAPSGVTTGPVVKAAKAFLAGLDARQRAKTMFAADDKEWRTWNNVHFAARAGVGFDEMTEAQRESAFALFRAGLSAKGLKRTRDVMRLNYTLAELTNKFDEYGEWLYWITIMGAPSETGPWGWQLDGHHVVINYFVLGDQVVMSPVFMGSEPTIAPSGKYKGTAVMQDEQRAGLALARTLDEAQRARAILSGEKGPTNNLAEAYKDNVVIDYAGIPASALNEKQQALLLEVVEEYVGNMDDGHAKVKMDEVRAHLDTTYFAWMGGTGKDSVFYYRIQSPVILIEFDHQRPIALGRDGVPTRRHSHSVLRTPNGNDYGKDLLRQHYEKHRHPATSE